MKIPPGMTEEEVLNAIQTAAAALIRFKFGPHDEDDIRQQAAMFAIQAINDGKYDPRPGPDGKPTRPLVNFIFTHSRNRLINFIRDTFRRADPPCRSCHDSLPDQTQHPDGRYCEKYSQWLKRNCAKQSICCPADISELGDACGVGSDEVVEEVETKELLKLIDTKLPTSIRGDYLRLRDGESLPKARRVEVENAVREIIKESLE